MYSALKKLKILPMNISSLISTVLCSTLLHFQQVEVNLRGSMQGLSLNIIITTINMIIVMIIIIVGSGSCCCCYISERIISRNCDLETRTNNPTRQPYGLNGFYKVCLHGVKLAFGGLPSPEGQLGQ